MHFKVEQHPSVVWFVKRECDETTRRAYYAKLDEVRSDPITNSVLAFDPKGKRPALRRFYFAHLIAVFEIDLWRETLRVLECRRPSKPTPGDGANRDRPANG
jgi:hypothetical protein